MKNYHIIKVKTLPVTENNSLRVNMYSYVFKTSVVIPFDYGFNGMNDVAMAYLANNGFNIIGTAELSDTENIIITDTFKRFKDGK